MHRALSFSLALLTAGVAHAQSSGAMAEMLFREGMQAYDQHHYDEACPKLAESQRLDPGSGTLLALASCHEAQGKTATAWSEFVEASSLAVRDGRRDRQVAAQGRAKTLEQRLVHLQVQLAHEEPGLSLTLDDVAVPPVAWKSAFPVDPGSHRLVATAPGKRPFSTTVVVPATGASTAFVPALEANDANASSSGEVAPQAKTDSTRRALGIAGIGVGVAAIGVGAGFGIHALRANHDATQDCPSSPCGNMDAVHKNESARTSAWIADIAIGGGVLVGAVGTFLLLTSTHARSQAHHKAPPVRLLLGPLRVGLEGVY